MREGVKSITPDERGRESIQLLPEIILGIADKLKDHMGKIKYSLLCFGKLTLMLFKTPEYVIVMSLEAGSFTKPIYEQLNSLLDLK
jgi:hypothetical protein